MDGTTVLPFSHLVLLPPSLAPRAAAGCAAVSGSSGIMGYLGPWGVRTPDSGVGITVSSKTYLGTGSSGDRIWSGKTLAPSMMTERVAVRAKHDRLGCPCATISSLDWGFQRMPHSFMLMPASYFLCSFYTMSVASAVPNHQSIGAASPLQGELFRFKHPTLLRTKRGTVTHIRSHQIQRRERIFLNIYHLHKCLNTKCFKCCCMGVFHSGVELFGTEVAFGGSPDESTGIFLCSPMHTVSSRHFGEQFELLSSTCVGHTKMTASHLTKLIDMIAPEWPANSYNLISRNCNHFVEFFLAQIACRHQPPPFVNRCSRLAMSVKCCLPQFITDMNFISPSEMCVPHDNQHRAKIICVLFPAIFLLIRRCQVFWARQSL